MKAIPSESLFIRPKTQVRGMFWERAKTGAFFAVSAFVLSGVRLFGQPLPLAACLVGSLPMGLNPILATFGAILGYFLRCEAAFAAEYTAVTLLMLAAVSVFQGTRLPSIPWFIPLIAACVCAVLGGIGILGGEEEISFLAVKVTLAALATAYFKKPKKQQLRFAYPPTIKCTHIFTS